MIQLQPTLKENDFSMAVAINMKTTMVSLFFFLFFCGFLFISVILLKSRETPANPPYADWATMQVSTTRFLCLFSFMSYHKTYNNF